jgi:hypothetical protein
MKILGLCSPCSALGRARNAHIGSANAAAAVVPDGACAVAAALGAGVTTTVHILHHVSAGGLYAKQHVGHRSVREVGGRKTWQAAGSGGGTN